MSLVRGQGEFEEKKCWGKIVHTEEKIGHRFPCILYFFIHPHPLTKAQHGSSLGTGALLFIESGQRTGGNLKKKNAGKKQQLTPKKKLGIGSPVFCTFSFTP